MIMFSVTPLYAAILAGLLVYLSVRVIAVRRAGKIGFGDGGDANLIRRIRAHGNLAEYAPMGVLLMALAEGGGTGAMVVHLIGIVLVGGRLLHAIGVSADPGIVLFRVAGMALTFTALIAGAAACVLAVAI